MWNDIEVIGAGVMSPLHVLEDHVPDSDLAAVSVVLSAVLEPVIFSVSLIVLKPRIIHRVGRVELARPSPRQFRWDISIL